MHIISSYGQTTFKTRQTIFITRLQLLRGLKRGNEHEGSNDYRDAFTGTVTAEVSAKSREATVAMGRPMAKFNFISTDVDEFIEMMQTIREKKTGKNSSCYTTSET